MFYRIINKCLSMGAIPADKEAIIKSIPYIEGLIKHLSDLNEEDIEDIIIFAFTYYRLTGDKNLKQFIDEVRSKRSGV